MRRIVLWFMSTVTMVVLLFGYHTSTAGAMKATSSAVAPIDASSGTSGSSGSSGSSNSSGSGSGSSGSDSSGQSGTFTGDLTQTQWGPIQVEITVENGKITDVGVPTYPASNGRDLEINSYALPILVQETVDAQNAQIDMVSGATVTSVGYLQSLQSALDQAGL